MGICDKSFAPCDYRSPHIGEPFQPVYKFRTLQIIKPIFWQ